MSRPHLSGQRGAALVLAIFVLVALGLLGVAMVTLFGAGSATPVLAVQGARAYQAARDGTEWGISRALAGSCVANTSWSLGGFSVTVGCADATHREGGRTLHVYTITAVAEYGAWGQRDYVRREVRTRVTDG